MDKELEKLVSEYVATYGVSSTREIVAYIEDTIGRTPSTATIAKILRALGYEPTKPAFWKEAE